MAAGPRSKAAPIVMAGIVPAIHAFCFLVSL
jgi:hypothetical protein